mgnify:CR=1 FL=1
MATTHNKFNSVPKRALAQRMIEGTKEEEEEERRELIKRARVLAHLSMKKKADAKGFAAVSARQRTLISDLTSPDLATTFANNEEGFTAGIMYALANMSECSRFQKRVNRGSF